MRFMYNIYIYTKYYINILKSARRPGIFQYSSNTIILQTIHCTRTHNSETFLYTHRPYYSKYEIAILPVRLHACTLKFMPFLRIDPLSLYLCVRRVHVCAFIQCEFNAVCVHTSTTSCIMSHNLFCDYNTHTRYELQRFISLNTVLFITFKILNMLNGRFMEGPPKKKINMYIICETNKPIPYHAIRKKKIFILCSRIPKTEKKRKKKQIHGIKNNIKVLQIVNWYKFNIK